MRALLPCTFSFALLALSPARSLAQDTTGTDLALSGSWRTDSAPAPTDNYGWQILTTDAMAAALIAIGLVEDEQALAWTGASIFVIGGPLIHLGYRRHSQAQTSLLLRGIAPGVAGLGGGLIARSTDSGDRDLIDAMAPGLVVGALLAVIIDSMILGRRDPPDEWAAGQLRLATSSDGAHLTLSTRM